MASFINNTDTLRNILEIVNNLQETTDAINTAIDNHNTSLTSHSDLRIKLEDASVLLNEVSQDIFKLYNEQEEILENLSSSSDSLNNLNPFFKTENKNIEIGHIDNKYKVQVQDDCFNVAYNNEPILNVSKNTVNTTNLSADTSLRVANYNIRKNSANDLIFV